MPTAYIFKRHNYLHALFACIAIFYCSLPCIAQLYSSKPGTDTQRINKLLFAAYSQKNTDSSLILLREVMRLGIEGKYAFSSVSAANKMATIYYANADYQQAMLLHKKALALSVTISDSSVSYYNIGNVYQTIGDYPLAAENYYEGLAVAKRTHSRAALQSLINCYSGLASVNIALKQDDKALRYLTLAEKTARQDTFYEELVTILNNKGGRYREHHKIDSALKCLTESQELSEKHSFAFLEGETQEELGEVYLDSGLYNKAIALFQASMAPGKCSDDCDIIRNYSSYGIAKALYALKQYKAAKDTITNAIKTGTALNIRDNIIEEYVLLEKICRATGADKQALNCADSIIALKDSLTGAAKATAINQMEMKYKSAEKDKLLSQNKLLIAEQQNKIARKNIWMISICGSLLLLLALAYGIYMQLIHKQRSREKESKIQTLRAVVEAGDNERSRIARELHDGIGGMLSASMMRFSSMHHESPEITNTQAYKDAMALLQSMGSEIRLTAHNLMPEVLLKQTLPEAVRVFCNTVARGNEDLKIHFQSYGTFDNITQATKLNIYRIIQELVKNVISHAQATKVLVQMMRDEDKLVVNVEDNGVGFDASKKSEGLGLHNITTRVSSMGGKFTLESVPGRGTTVLVEFLELAEKAETH